MKATHAVVLAFASAAVLSSTTGCATARPIGPMDTSHVRYRDPALDETALRQAGVAVLPVTAREARDGAAAERQGGELAEALAARQVCAMVLPPAEVRERFAREGVSDRFESMLGSLSRTGELDRNTLDAMARATGCRYFLQASTRSGWSHHTAAVNGAPHSSHAVTSELHAQLWDAATGEVVWEGAGGGAALTTPPHQGNAAQVEDVAVRGLAMRVGADPATQPPPLVVADLHDMDHAETMEVADENHARAHAVSDGLEIFVAVLEVAAAIADIAD